MNRRNNQQSTKLLGRRGRRNTRSIPHEEQLKRQKKKILQVVFSSGTNRPHPKMGPKGPVNGAMYSHRSLLETYTDSTGLTTSNSLKAATSTVFASVAFEIGDLDDFTSLSGAFDQYRIDWVDVFIKPSSNSYNGDSNASPNQARPNLYCVVDRDDATQPTSISQLRQYNECLEASSYEGVYFGFKPSVTPAYYSTGSFVGYGVEESQWIDVASSTVPHYGLKMAVEPLQATSTDDIIWRVETYLYTSWKSSR